LTIIGPSGCGKTTLLRIIAGLERPDRGRISIDSGEKTTPIIPIVWQEHRLLPWRTAIKNVCLGLEIARLPKEDIIRRAERYLNLVGLKEYTSFYPAQLSYGMQQRVALARALAVEPRILLLDEPFSSADHRTKTSLMAKLEELRKLLRLPMIYVSHNIEDALLFSTKIVVLTKKPARIKKIYSSSDVKKTTRLDIQALIET